MNRMTGRAAAPDRLREGGAARVMSPKVRALTEACRGLKTALPGEGKNAGDAWETAPQKQN
jgi:hypothetical protein